MEEPDFEPRQRKLLAKVIQPVAELGQKQRTSELGRNIGCLSISLLPVQMKILRYKEGKTAPSFSSESLPGLGCKLMPPNYPPKPFLLLRLPRAR